MSDTSAPKDCGRLSSGGTTKVRAMTTNPALEGLTEAMIEAGYAIMSQTPFEAGCDYKQLLGRAYLAMQSARPAPTENYQSRVAKWMEACFSPEVIADKLERSDRFIEEALEFVQAAGYSAERAHALVDYTFGRPVGEINQEVGGVMVTLAAMCNTLDVNIDAAAETELARVWTKIDAIRAKQATKPVGAALPVPTEDIRPVASDDVKRVATHRCKQCDALWRRWDDGSWSLCSVGCGECCDVAPMGDQIEPIAASPSRDALVEIIREARGYVDGCFGDLDQALLSKMDDVLDQFEALNT